MCKHSLKTTPSLRVIAQSHLLRCIQAKKAFFAPAVRHRTPAVGHCDGRALLAKEASFVPVVGHHTPVVGYYTGKAFPSVSHID